MRRNSEGRVRVKGGFWEISCFPLISRSLGAAWAVVHVKTAMVMNERMIFLMIFFPYHPIPPLIEEADRGKRQISLSQLPFHYFFFVSKALNFGPVSGHFARTSFQPSSSAIFRNFSFSAGGRSITCSPACFKREISFLISSI